VTARTLGIGVRVDDVEWLERVLIAGRMALADVRAEPEKVRHVGLERDLEDFVVRMQARLTEALRHVEPLRRQ
jgi:hypothetical protein